MNVEELIQYISWVIYVMIFIVTLVRAVRRPLAANIDIALLFASTAAAIGATVALRSQLLPAGNRIVGTFTVGAVLAMAYLLLRLVDDFSDVPAVLLRVSEVGVVALTVSAFLLEPKLPPLFTLVLLSFLIALFSFSTFAFARASRTSTGVTRRRMRAVTAGSLALASVFAISGLTTLAPNLVGVWRPLSTFMGLTSAVFYFLGFAPPSLVRRAWQEPELRAFLGRAASLPRLPDTPSILREMERGAATSVGAPRASIGLWNEDAGVLEFNVGKELSSVVPTMEMVTGRSFLQQKALFTPDLERASPTTVEQSRQYGIKAFLVAPITAGEKRLGVLTVHAPRAPIFADEDLDLVQLLADQAAVILESRALIDEAARVRAREEVTRLKEDFLSAAAHDLKTPLTTLVAQTQLLERKALRSPDAPADVAGLRKLIGEAQRLRDLVLELLDASRVEQGRLVGELDKMDLAEVAQQVCARYSDMRRPCHFDARGPVTGNYDRTRIVQLVENLVENAYKYSPDGGMVTVRAWRDGQYNHLQVADEGIGIPADDLPHIFNRFHRAKNVDDRRFTGMGLGLYICRGIAAEHGGRISVESAPNKGSTFHVVLPVNVSVEIQQEAQQAAYG